MKKEVRLFNQTYQAKYIAEDSEWLLNDIKIEDKRLNELYVPDQNGELPHNLEEFVKFLTDNWDSIHQKGKEAIDFLKKDWFQPDYQPEFELEYIVLESTDSIGSYRLHFYDGFSDTYGDWIVKYYFNSLRGVERDWL